MGYCFIIIGAGGIGGNVARDLPKLMTKRSNEKMIIIDGDTVEEKNCVRQPFQKQDIGQNKARILARKINSFYNIDCEARDFYITDKELDVIVANSSEYVPVFIGCVDNDKTRKLIESSFMRCKTAVYIDGANSEYDGNIYVSRIDAGGKSGPIRSDVYELENDVNPGEAGCEVKVANGELQYLITNNKVAAWIIDVLHTILRDGHYQLKTGVIVVERFNVFFR